MRCKMFFTLVLLFGFHCLLWAKVVDEPDLKAAKKTHEKECSRCHGKDGKGDGKTSKMLKVKPADWTDSERMSPLSDEELFLIIEKGGKGAGKSILMPAFGSKLSKEQMKDLVSFIRSLLEPSH